MIIPITASRLMKAGEVKKQCRMWKTDFDEMKRMLDLQIQIKEQIKIAARSGKHTATTSSENSISNNSLAV